MEEKHQFYKELSKTVKDGAGLQVNNNNIIPVFNNHNNTLQSLPKGTKSSDFVSSFIKSSVEEKKINEGLERQLQTQVMLLDPPQNIQKQEKKKSTLALPAAGRLNAKQRRTLFEVPKEEQK